MFDVPDVAVGQPDPVFDVLRGQQSPVCNRVPQVGSVFGYQVDQALAELLGAVVPGAFRDVRRQEVYPHRQHMMTVWSYRVVVHGRYLHLDHRRFGNPAVLGIVPCLLGIVDRGATGQSSPAPWDRARSQGKSRKSGSSFREHSSLADADSVLEGPDLFDEVFVQYRVASAARGTSALGLRSTPPDRRERPHRLESSTPTTRSPSVSILLTSAPVLITTPLASTDLFIDWVILPMPP